jgi:hypothetical protein
MGASERQERQRQEPGKEILLAVRGSFTVFSYGQATVRRIAENTKFSPNTIGQPFR